MINNIKNRQMPVFLSSTFHDMQEERDVLIINIFPKLRNLAEQRLVTLTPIDLRWGITEDESKTGKVIELCLQEIERCQPFFIGILGNHYGWCPSISDMKENTMLLDQYQWLQKDLEEGLSITEIEMQFAVLRKQRHANMCIVPGLTHQLPKIQTVRGVEGSCVKSSDDFFSFCRVKRPFFRRKRHAEAALFDYQVVTGV